MDRGGRGSPVPRAWIWARPKMSRRRRSHAAAPAPRSRSSASTRPGTAGPSRWADESRRVVRTCRRTGERLGVEGQPDAVDHDLAVSAVVEVCRGDREDPSIVGEPITLSLLRVAAIFDAEGTYGQVSRRARVIARSASSPGQHLGRRGPRIPGDLRRTRSLEKRSGTGVTAFSRTTGRGYEIEGHWFESSRPHSRSSRGRLASTLQAEGRQFESGRAHSSSYRPLPEFSSAPAFAGKAERDGKLCSSAQRPTFQCLPAADGYGLATGRRSAGSGLAGSLHHSAAGHPETIALSARLRSADFWGPRPRESGPRRARDRCRPQRRSR
jgi:hypothetical protein